MAAMMGSMITNAGEQDRIRKEMMAVFKLLKSTGGALSPDKACSLLGMSQDELKQRIIDRSILGILVHLDLYIPAFQFEGAFHIPMFHEVWDVLQQNCSPLEICAFFVAESLEAGGSCIRDVLHQNPKESCREKILQKAANYRKAAWMP